MTKFIYNKIQAWRPQFQNWIDQNKYLFPKDFNDIFIMLITAIDDKVFKKLISGHF